MISANGGLPAHRYTPQVTPRWPRGSEPASADALDQLDSTYEVAEFPVRIYHDTCSFQSADHYSGPYVDAEGSLCRGQSQSTCLDVEFRSWA